MSLEQNDVYVAKISEYEERISYMKSCIVQLEEKCGSSKDIIISQLKSRIMMNCSTISEQQETITALQVEIKRLETHIPGVDLEKNSNTYIQQCMIGLELERRCLMSTIAKNNVKLEQQNQETLTIIGNLEEECGIEKEHSDKRRRIGM